MVKLREGESIDSLIRRFKKEVDDSGILKEWRDRQYFQKPSTKRHKEKMRAKRRAENNLREEREKEKTRKGR
jgi:small subunit ribosomal protein S21